MRRRTLLTGLPVGGSLLAGCLNGSNSNTGTEASTDTASDAPDFEIDDDVPGAFILLRNQPQEPNGVTAGDEFEIGVVLGNAGGEPLSGELSVELIPPNEETDADAQTATIVVEDDNAIPSGAAKFFTTGLFEATVAGDWELVAGPEIEQVHPTYDPIITVEELPTN